MAPSASASSSKPPYREPSLCGIPGLRLPDPVLGLGVLLAIAYLTIVAFTDRGEGALYDFAYFILREQVVAQVIFVLMVLAHVGEAIIALYLAHAKARLPAHTTALWTLFTFVVGYPSLMHLRRLAHHRGKQAD